MVEVTIFKTYKHDYVGFDVKGHANPDAESGHDIICAAISMLVINTINSIERYTKDQFSLVEDEVAGVIEFRFDSHASHDAELLLRSMILGLESLEDEYHSEPFIDIIFEEV